jgi:exosome complex RNA-binding protein Rrp4
MGRKIKTIKYKDGNLINIGDWENKREINPLPENSAESNAEVVVGYNGGLYLADNPRRLGN